jgi:hypothetical protein
MYSYKRKPADKMEKIKCKNQEKKKKEVAGFKVLRK